MPFDPTQPFETVTGSKPAAGGFDPSQPFETIEGPSALEAAGRGAANNVPLMPQVIAGGEAALGDKGYSENLADWNAKAAAAKAAHPVAYGAGATAGTVSPALALGPAAEAAPLLTGAGLGAASAISNTDLVKEPGKAAEEAALGAGTGALLGKAGDWLSDMIGGGSEAMANKANDIRARGMGLSPKLLGKLEPEEVTEYGSFAKANDLLDQNVEGALGRATAAKEAAGQEIGKIGADALPLTDAKPYIRPLAEKAAKLHGVAGAEADERALYNGMQNIVTKGKTFGQLQDLKNFYGEKAFDAAHQVKDPVSAAIYHSIKDAMGDVIDTAPEHYQGAMKTYKMANDAVSGLTKKLGQQRNGAAGEGLGFMGRILGKMPGQSNPAINLPTAAAIGALGHPMMGLMAATPSINNPAVQAGTIDALAKSLPNIPRPALLAAIEKLTGKQQ